MGIVQGSQGKKDLNVELNLLPVFDVLSVCICFLLMTVVWIEVQSLETKQAIGSESQTVNQNEVSLWITVSENKDITLDWKSGVSLAALNRQKNSAGSISPVAGEINWNQVQKFLLQAKAKTSISNAHILPAAGTKYQDVIRLMDLLKAQGIQNVGLSPTSI